MKTHDYTKRTWGHDYIFQPIRGGLRGQATGWGKEINKGDLLLLENKANKSGSSLYKVVSILYFADPPDMWSAELEWVPRDSQ